MAIEKNLRNTPIDPRVAETQIAGAPSDDAAFVETEFDNGDIEIDFDEESVNEALQEGVVNINDEHFTNLAENIDEATLNTLSEEVVERFEDDKSSRSEWLDTVNDGLSLLGIHVEETDDPFPGACTAHHPLIVEAAVKFQAKASNELFSPKGPVKTAVIGKPTPEKEDQAKRVRNHMNYQVMQQMSEYFDETETMLFYLPIVGSSFKKTYYDPILDRPVSAFVPVDQFVVNYYSTNLKSSPCFTHMIQRMAYDLKKDQVNRFYRDVELTYPRRTIQGETEITVDELMGEYANADEKVYTLLEQYCYLDLGENDTESDPDGIPLPYVITIVHETNTVLSIRRNWAETDDQRQPIIPFTHYKFVPGLGFYGLGFIHLLGNLQMTLTSAMRSLIDSGTFATMQGGFVDKRLRIRDNDGPIAPGEFKEVEAGGLALKDAIFNLPFKEPSTVLLQMYQFVEARGQKFADSTEEVVSDATNYGPVGTTMALLEASGKFFTGVHKRLHKAQKNEFAILSSLNFEYLGESEEFDVVGNTFNVSKADYDGRIDVVPVSDPNLGSQAQKLSVAQAIYTAALQKQDIHDVYEVSKYYYGAIGVDDDYIDKFLPPPEEAQEQDPLTDIQSAQQGKAIAAFPGQDHMSHVQVKTAFLQDPESGANPAMQMIVPVIQANIQEHLILKFQTEIAGTVASGGGGEGAPQGGPEEAIVAQAAQQVSQKNQQITELQAQSPDEARNKLADAEVQRAVNETRKIELENDDKIVQRAYDAMKLELDKYSEDNKLLIAEMQTQAKAQELQMKEMSDLIKESMKIKAAAESQTKQLNAQKQETPKEKPKGVDKE